MSVTSIATARAARFDPAPHDPEIELARAGWMSAAMGLPLDPDAPEAFRVGYSSYRHDDGAALDAIEDERSETLRRLYADGMLPERRRGVESQAHRYTGWDVLLAAVVALVAGLAAPELIAGLRAVFGGAA